jgi:hypothetical protein
MLNVIRPEASVRHFSVVIIRATARIHKKCTKECVKVLRPHVSCPYICSVKLTLIGRVVVSPEKAETP